MTYRLPRSCPWSPKRVGAVALQDSLPWAVWLGANTSRRLAAEWGITLSAARWWLRKGVKTEVLRVVAHARGRSGWTRYRVNRLEIGMSA